MIISDKDKQNLTNQNKSINDYHSSNLKWSIPTTTNWEVYFDSMNTLSVNTTSGSYSVYDPRIVEVTIDGETIEYSYDEVQTIVEEYSKMEKAKKESPIVKFYWDKFMSFYKIAVDNSKKDS